VSTTQPLPPDGHIELAFDRLLMPSITIRQTFVLADVRGNLLTPGVAYDPVARVVTITPMAPLEAGQRYQLAITSPRDPSDPNGLRAVDGALLDPSSASVIEFVVSASDSGTSAGGVMTPTIDFCNDVLPAFVTKCSSTSCHGGSPRPAAGLLLDSPTNVAATALGRVAQGANTGPRSTAETPCTCLAPMTCDRCKIFGINMPIIDTGTSQPAAGNPANSWLMYKLFLAVPPACSSTPGAAPCDGGVAGDAGTLPANVSQTHAVAWAPMTDTERAALSDLVPGREMPFPARPETPAGATTEPMTVDELERVSLWIAQGARVPAACP
jgi:hypothetical protein